MDKRLQQAIDFANYQAVLTNQLHKLQIKTDGLLIFSFGGGKFTISRELICFLDYLVREEYSDTVLLDDNKSPVHIEDTADFLKAITARYTEVTNDYLQSAHKIKKSRNVKSIVNIQD